MHHLSHKQALPVTPTYELYASVPDSACLFSIWHIQSGDIALAFLYGLDLISVSINIRGAVPAERKRELRPF